MAFVRNAPKATLLRSLPAGVTYEQACDRVKAAGLGTLARSYFTKIRSESGRVKSNGRHASDAPAPTLSNEQQFRKLVIALGTERARKLLKDFESMSWS